MKFVIIYIFAAVAVVNHIAYGAAMYPAYKGVRTVVDEKKITEELIKVLGGFRSSYGDTGPSALILLEHVGETAKTFPDEAWSLTTADGKMPLPEIFLAPFSWSENFSVLGYFSLEPQQIASFAVYDFLLGELMSKEPDRAFNWILRRSNDSTVRTIDLLNFKALIRWGWPGEPPEKKGTYDVWKQLHDSVNPCCRLTALEQFESVPQTPERLLNLYRECLFNSCTFLERRALEAIWRNRDFRPQVLVLLEEYLKSGPPANDGTHIYIRTHFADCELGAKSLIDLIKKELGINAYSSADASRVESPKLLLPSNPNHQKK